MFRLMQQSVLVLIGVMVMASGAAAGMTVKTMKYEQDGVQFEGFLVYDDTVSKPRPGLVMVPNWMGPTAAAIEKAKQVAKDRYVVLVADMYGVTVRPANADEAGKAAGAVRADRAMMRARAQRAVDVLTAQKHVPLAPGKLAAIGFCFGGGTVLELARSGADIAAVVSFHGNLDTPDPADAKRIRSKVLVLHGAVDPYVPKEQVDAFMTEMKDAEVDWQLVSFGGAVHSFTDPHAKQAGAAEYHPVVAKRAFGMMEQLFDEVF